MNFKVQLLVAVCSLTLSVVAQSTFQNLNFEQANLPVVPPGQPGGLVATSNAIPGWTAYYGDVLVPQITYNDMSLGAVNISILGPNWEFFPILQGSYSVLLQSGLVASTTMTPASIAQTGLIPESALSVQWSAALIGGDASQLAISIGAQNLPIVPMSTTGGYTVYGADVSAFAGTTTELRISSVPALQSPYNWFLIDSIAFSSQPIPEPGTLGLFALGALLLGWHLRRIQKR